MRNPLLDLEFLRKLDLMKNKATYAKIILLTWDENPVYEIQGKITAGSINIDGNSAVRRTCSLTMVSPDVDITNTYWALKNKFKLEVGVENEIDSQYPDIIWFKQGTYVFTSLNMNVQSNNFTISLNGKDKMCLLNGEVGGSINASTDFGKMEEYETLENGEIIRNIIDIPIVDIIKNAVHTYAGEPMSNIVLNDIDNYGLELLEYRGDKHLYMPRHVASGEVSNIVINPKQIYYLENGNQIYVDNDENLKHGNSTIIYYNRTGLNENIATKVYSLNSKNQLDYNNPYNIIKIEFGETAGYRRTELTYPGDLIANIGESLVSILDKIKNMFADFEYFYDVDGRFIFQKKKTYVNTSFNNLQIEENEIYANDALYTSATTYSFEDGVLLSAFTDTPQILNIKNDFSIWGKRKGVSGDDLPVHMRYAIDFKPIYYKPIRFEYELVALDKDSYKPNQYYIKSDATGKYILSTDLEFDENQKSYFKETNEQKLNIPAFTIEEYDWREIIYQMALDYFKYNYKKDNFTELVAKANPEYYPSGITGYEQYYTDLQGYWRQLYHPASINNGEYYDIFTHSELLETARNIIIDERAFIEEEDISQLIIDYIYKNFNTIRNNFIENIDYTVGTIDPARDILQVICTCVGYGFTENTKVIKGLLADRWEKMNGIDNYDYETLMREEYKINGKSALYKTYQILNNYKLEKQFLDEYENIDLSLEIGKKISEGYTEESATIQGLLSLRWKKIMLTYGEDPFDYFDLMEKEYIQNGNSGLYQAYNLMYNYTIMQEKEKIDENKIFMYEDEKGKVKIKDPYLSFLYDSRQNKIDNYNYDSVKIGNEKFMGIIVNVIKTFEIGPSQFKEQINLMFKHQTNQGAYDFTQELINYIADHYDEKKNFFYVNENTNKISVEHSYVQYLLNMRQEKIDELGGDNFYISNTILVINIIKLLETNQTGSAFKSAILETLDSVWSPLDKDDYDFSLEVLDYIVDNYKNKDKLFTVQSVNNIITVNDQYIQFLLIMRDEKIQEKYGDDFYPQNNIFVSIVVDAMNKCTSASDFRKMVSEMLDKFYYQFHDSNYDFSFEIIEYITNNYSNFDNFFSGAGTSIVVKDDYIKHLLNMRQNKLNRLEGSVSYISNAKLIEFIIDTKNENLNDADGFKSSLLEKLKNWNG